MGGSKNITTATTVNPTQYISQRDPARDIAIATALQNAQAQQQATQAEMLKTYTGMYPEMQRFDAAAESQKAAQIGLQNELRKRELNRIVNPEAEAFRRSQAQQVEDLTAKENLERYMAGEYMRTQGLPSQYETGISGTIGRAAMYDRALAARRAYEENLAAQRQAYLAGKAEPVGGLSPEASIAARQGIEAQNLAAQEAYKQGILGSAAGLSQTGSQMANQQFANYAAMQQAQQQSEQAYNQMRLNAEAQNIASKNALKAGMIGAAGNIISTGLNVALAAKPQTGMTSAGFYRSPIEASAGYNVPTSNLSYQKSTGLGGLLGIGKEGGYFYNPK